MYKPIERKKDGKVMPLSEVETRLLVESVKKKSSEYRAEKKYRTPRGKAAELLCSRHAAELLRRGERIPDECESRLWKIVTLSGDEGMVSELPLLKKFLREKRMHGRSGVRFERIPAREAERDAALERRKAERFLAERELKVASLSGKTDSLSFERRGKKLCNMDLDELTEKIEEALEDYLSQGDAARRSTKKRILRLRVGYFVEKGGQVEDFWNVDPEDALEVLRKKMELSKRANARERAARRYLETREYDPECGFPEHQVVKAAERMERNDAKTLALRGAATILLQTGKVPDGFDEKDVREVVRSMREAGKMPPGFLPSRNGLVQ